MNAKITVTLKRSLNGKTKKIKDCIYGLGLRKIGQKFTTLENTPSVRGMIKKAIHLLDVTE